MMEDVRVKLNPGLPWQKLHSARRTLFTSKLDLNLRKKLVNRYIWSVALYGAETWTLQAAGQKYLGSFEMWCLRRMEKISWTDHVRNEEVLLRVNGQRNVLHEIRKRKANWIGHILRRNCLLKQVIEGKIKTEMEVIRRRGRRRKKLLDDLKNRRRYSHLKEEALDRTMWRNRFRRGFEPVVRQNTEGINELLLFLLGRPWDFTKLRSTNLRKARDGSIPSALLTQAVLPNQRPLPTSF